MPNRGTNERRPNVAAAPLAESTRRDTRSRSLQRMVRRYLDSLRTLHKSLKMVGGVGCKASRVMVTVVKLLNNLDDVEAVVGFGEEVRDAERTISGLVV